MIGVAVEARARQLSATRKLSCNRVQEVIEANRHGNGRKTRYSLKCQSIRELSRGGSNRHTECGHFYVQDVYEMVPN